MNLGLKIISIGLATASVFPWPNELLSQNNNVRFKRLSLEQGLSQNTVYCILQDSKGFIWVGTQDGLNKYDGYDFKVYKHDPDNPHSLSNNVIRTIHEDSREPGVLWIGTNGGGLNRYDRATDSFTYYQHEPDNPQSISDDYVLKVYEAPHQPGVLWIGTRWGGINKLVLSPAFSRGGSASMDYTFQHYGNIPDDTTES